MDEAIERQIYRIHRRSQSLNDFPVIVTFDKTYTPKFPLLEERVRVR